MGCPGPLTLNTPPLGNTFSYIGSRFDRPKKRGSPISSTQSVDSLLAHPNLLYMASLPPLSLSPLGSNWVKPWRTGNTLGYCANMSRSVANVQEGSGE